jgi:hypothetical protein
LKNIFLSFIVFSFVGCSLFDKKSDDNPTPNVFADISLTTIAPTIANNSIYVTTGGTSNLNLTSVASVEYGVCFSDLPNPTVLNNQVSANNQGEKEFGVTINNIKLGSIYYFKAYVRNYQTGEVKYGNEVSLAIPLSLNTVSINNISTTGFTVEAFVGENLSSNTKRGICFSTSENPTINNSILEDVTAGSGTFYLSTNQFVTSKNTNYYIRSFVYLNGNYYYGNQLSARTTGYIGGSGGYIFYDKGIFSDGWRYLEAAPTPLINNQISPSSNYRWSCNSNFISNNSIEIGKGLENSLAIKNACNFANVAGSFSINYGLNNQTDWFLPSLNELRELYKLKTENVISYTNSSYVWSSSQSTNSLAYVVYFNGGLESLESKFNYHLAWQVRRF